MTTLHINGMHCGACVRRVTAALSKLPATKVHSVEVGSARIDTSAPDHEVLEAVKKAGFTATLERA